MAGGQPVDAPAAAAAEPRRRRGFRLHRWILGTILALVLIVVGALAWLDTPSGHRFLVARIAEVRTESGLRIAVGSIEGSIYKRAVLHGVRLSDPRGLFFSAPTVALDWYPFAWLDNRLDIDRLIIPEATLHKLPKLNPTRQQGPILPGFDIRLMDLRVGRLTIAKAITGTEQAATMRGRADIRSGRAVIDLNARELTGSDAFILALDSRPDDDKFDVEATVNAPAGGVLATMAGLKQDANLSIHGNGGWTRWNGTLTASLDKAPFAALSLVAASGHYMLDGTVQGDRLAGKGLVAKLTAPHLQLNAQGMFERRVLDGTVKLRSDAFALNAHGALDLAHGQFDDLRTDIALTRPDRLVKNARASGLLLKTRIDGPFNALDFDYLLSARQLAFGKTQFSDLRAQGKGHAGRNGPTLIPMKLTAGRVSGQSELVDGILRNLSLDGVLQVQGKAISSNRMQLRTNKISSRIVLLADTGTGRYKLALTGGIKGLLIPGLGIVDVQSDISAAPGAKGGFTLQGKAQAAMRRMDNAFLSGLAGGLPRVTSNLALGPDGRLMLGGLRLQGPAISLAANGYRRPDGSYHFDGAGTHGSYGAFRAVLDGHIERPAVELTLARPMDAAGLKEVHVKLAPDAGGYGFTAEGESALGAFSGNGAILLPHGGQSVIDVRNLQLSGAQAHGQLRPVTGGLDGRLEIAGGGLSGFVALQPVNGIQQMVTAIDIDRASFAGPPPITIARGTVKATVLLAPGGASIDATADLRAVRRGALRLGRMGGTAKLVGGRGTVDMAFTGQRGRLFDLKLQAAVEPGHFRITGGGTLDRKPVQLSRAVMLTRTADGWQLAPMAVAYLGGQAQLSGRLGGEGTRIEARLEKLPLTLLDLYNSDLGLGGIATGTLSYAHPRGGMPAGKAELRIRGLTRSGLVLSSTPVDAGVNALLTTDRLAARAVIVSGGKTIGQAQALLTPLDGGSLMQRLDRAPLFAQLRYNGNADTLWRLTNVETFDLSGPIAIGADLRGTLANPVIAGSLMTDNGRVESPITGMVVSNIKARGHFSGSRLVLSSFAGATKGGGSISGSGSFDLSAERGVAIDMDMQAKEATLLDRDDLGATVTGPVQVHSDGDGGLISGDFDLVKSRFVMGRAAAVAEIPQLRVIEVNRRGEEIDSGRPPSPWRMAIHANARNRLAVTGMGLNSEWRADLKIAGTVTNPTILGTADLIRGNYEFAGRRFDLKDGEIRFTGNSPINPAINIEAAANVTDLSATIKVTGTGLQPQISFTSIPAMPEDELLSRLLFGTSITKLSAPEAVQLATAVASMRGGHGGLDPINAVRKAAGLDRLRILPADPTTGQGTSVAAGKYITRKTYVELVTDGAGYSATRVEFQITRWLALLSSVSTIGRQSVNVRISKDY